MRRDGIPYVSNGVYNPPFPAVPLQDMTLEEIKKKYLKMCAKSNGNPSVCSKCPSPCAEGKRAIQLIANEVYSDPPVPLYGGKTLIERAKEENMLRRQNLENKNKEEKKMSKEKQYVENWWEDSLASGDQVAWVMERFNMSKTQAKKKIYSYRYRNGLTNKEYFTNRVAALAKMEENTSKTSEEKQEEKTEEKVPVETATQDACADITPIEGKIDSLMRQQAECKKTMDDSYKIYLEAKEVYESFSKKIDILCNAMDIMNE